MRLTEAGWPKCGPFTFDDWFSIKGFKNGNAHLTFLRSTIVDELNRIVARHHRHVLPPAEDEQSSS
jgi:hypothetical protein